jgi:HAMP domain-containing protein
MCRRQQGDLPVKSTGKLAKYLALCSAAILFVACVNQMEPAKYALDNINATLGAVAPDAQQYVPDQLASAQTKVAELTASYDKKDYAAVVKSAPAVLAEVNGLAGAVATKKDERLKALGNEWRSLAASVPQSVTAVQARIDALSKTKHAPKDIDLTAAKSGLTDATSAWENAQSKFKSGNAEDAVAAAKDATNKLESAAGALKLNLPQTSP